MFGALVAPSSLHHLMGLSVDLGRAGVPVPVGRGWFDPLAFGYLLSPVPPGLIPGVPRPVLLMVLLPHLVKAWMALPTRILWLSGF